MKLRETLGKLNKNDQGVTLVEVVISLLIIAVIFTPLLMTFIQASKVNRKTNTNAYAQDVAENIMEQVKAMGVVGYAEYADTQTNIEPEETYVADGKFYVPFGPDGKRKPYDDYSYTITGLKQGSQEYDARVYIKSSVYKNITGTPTPTPDPFAEETPTPAPTPLGNLNDYVFADFSAFSSEKTVLVFPKTNDTIYQPEVPEGTPTPTPKTYAGFDDKAVSYFMDLNEDYIERLYLADRDKVDARNAEIEAWNENNPGLEPTPLVPLPPRGTIRKESEIRETVERTIHIKVERLKNGSNETTGYRINSWVEYTASNSKNYYGGNGEGPFSVTYKGYCTNVELTDIQSVFLLYNVAKPSLTGEKMTEKIDVWSDIGKDLDLYIAIQVENKDDVEAYDKYPELDINETLTGTDTKINYYSQGKIRINGGLGNDESKHENSLIKDMATASNRLYLITVEVYEHIEPGLEAGEDEEEPPQPFSNLITTISSTYVNDSEIKAE
ncbi:MAG: prepilin-type N-terminal cleavage/methylation domain-containing protein [Lachnospiraceae bacterium]|nr:prepilin-type N-terminal cleavage/methylation domain-containing protein [Lachnospiraceae bacterium]